MNKKNARLTTLFFLLVILPFQFAIAGNLLDKANTAFDRQDFKSALSLYEQVLQKEKRNLNVIMWAAESAGQIKQHAKQIALLHSLVELDPKGLKGRQLLIKALEQAGKANESKIEVKKLILLRQSQPDEIKKKERFFIRDTFKAGLYRVIAFQYYELEGQWAKRYHFLAQKKKDELPYTVSFGSYPTLTKIEREMGKIKANERIWHLDGYTGKKHFTYGFFEVELGYQKVKKMAIKLFELGNPAKNSISSIGFEGGLMP